MTATALPPRLPRPEQLSGLPDRELAELTALLVRELQRRIMEGGAIGPDIDRAVQKAASDLGRLCGEQTRPPTGERSPPLANGKRNAIRAALSAGIKPTQVARHFGVSLADVRRVAAQPE